MCSQSKLVVRQLEKDASKNNISGKPFLVIHTMDFVNVPAGSTILIDEGDLYFKEHLLKFRENGDITGLASLRDKRVFMMTATLKPYWKQIFLKTFGLSSEAIKEFPTAL